MTPLYQLLLIITAQHGPRDSRREGMHCLGAVSGADSASPSGMTSSRGGVMSVVRALGVLVCEGRIQGPPRGYKEGPHCAAPLQPPVNDHTCDKDNYLCGRYLVLVREIAERIAIGASLCVEVLMCSDCPCGLARATCKDPVSLSASGAISQWQHPSDVLLEYWSVSVVPCKSPEMMNSQGLYQAVRSRLHFSQVAAWWSRSNGTKPNYVATRIVSYNDDNLRKFRESPIEHTFPLAGMGDGNSIKVTVWALPRMEEVPTLNCPLHPLKDNEEECVARALTPTKNGPVPSSSHTAEALVLPVLVDDRLQTPCDKPGKHHCHCEDEDGCPPSPSIRPNGERKRRRSLPCGPSDSASHSSSHLAPQPLPSVRETITSNTNDSPENSSYPHHPEYHTNVTRTHRPDNERSQRSETTTINDNHSQNNTSSNLETNFRSQISLDEHEGNDEKRYKPSSEILETNETNENVSKIENSSSFPTKTDVVDDNPTTTTTTTTTTNENSMEKFDNSQFYELATSTRFNVVTNETNDLRRSKDSRNLSRNVSRDTNLVINPFADVIRYRETNNLSSMSFVDDKKNISPPTSSSTMNKNYSRSSRSSLTNEKCLKIDETGGKDVVKNCFATGKDISNLMAKLTFPKEKNVSTSVVNREDGGIFDWFSRVPARVIALPATTTTTTTTTILNPEKTKIPDDKILREKKMPDGKLKNCNLELSKREFDEVLAVLRSRTPSGRKRTPVKNIRRRERSERSIDDNSRNNDDRETSTICPLHRELRRNDVDDCLCEICKKIVKPEITNVDGIDHRCRVTTCSTDAIANTANDGNSRTMEKTCERLQKVSNKADVLLGAILRTRERKGLSDISNGTIPRTTIIENHENSSFDVATSNSRTNEIEEDRSLPSVINKRLSRFKQLFKKESDNRRSSAITEDKFIRNNADNDFSSMKLTSKIISHDANRDDEKILDFRAKRKIVATNLAEDSGRSRRIYETAIDRRDFEINGDSKILNNSNFRENEEILGCKILGSETVGMNDVDTDCSRRNNAEIACVDDVDDDETFERGVPSAIEQERFRRSLENAASMVFHSRTGLPLTSSPAPLRRGSCCFDYDSSLISVSSKRSALFELNTPPSPGAVSLEETDREIENSCEGEETPKRTSTARSRPQSHALLGSFEESALNGRLEPVSTVHGFTAELGASGSFCPKHRKLPVTVFFYTLGDNDKVSTPYLAHINLGKKGYQVPRSGTIQVTLLNPLGTVVKMFVVLYDLSDMPPRSHTFLRQRTLRDKTLRYLVHLRFMSGKSGRIYLHTDIRMIICRKSDVDTASDFGSEPPKELRSYIHGPTNPKFSPRC